MARGSGHDELAVWMASVIAARQQDGGRKPAELAWGEGWRKEWADDGLSGCLVDRDGRVMRTMRCTPHEETVAGTPLVTVNIEGADGRRLATHEPHRISDTAVDIHMLDAAGRLRGILHHTEMDRAPHTIREEWFDRGW